MGFTSSRHGCTIGTENKSVKFFLNFFFVGCGCVGARVWLLGCGCVGVGARVGMGAGWMERAEDGAGWIKIGAVGLLGARLPGLPTLRSGCWLVCDR